MPVQPGDRLAVDGRVQHPAAGGVGLAGQHEQARGVVPHPVPDIGEGLQMLVGGQLPVRAHNFGVDPAAELAEGGVGVDGHHPVLAQFGENRTDGGGHGGLTHAALAHDADLVMPTQDGPDARFQLCLVDLIG